MCGHALKVLDLMNIKSLPAQYILKRWTREARSGIVTDNKGINIIENPMMEASLRYKFLSHRFLTLAQQAASYPECTLLVNNTLDILSKQIEEHLSGYASTSNQSATHKEVMPPNNLLSNARLKKKEVRVRSSKQKRNWLNKKRDTTQKRQSKKGKSPKVCSKKILQYHVTIQSCVHFILLHYLVRRNKRLGKMHSMLVQQHKWQKIVLLWTRRSLENTCT